MVTLMAAGVATVTVLPGGGGGGASFCSNPIQMRATAATQSNDAAPPNGFRSHLGSDKMTVNGPAVPITCEVNIPAAVVFQEVMA